jgi:predicted Zn-dependent protease
LKYPYLIAIAMLAVACASTQREQKEVAKEQLIQETKEEVEIGRGMAARLLGEFGLDEAHPESWKYLNLLGTQISKRFGRPELEYRFAILATDEVNALACPGGFIFVTRGLLKQILSESELATVLSHEIAHVNEKHMYDMIKPKRDVSATETLGRIFSRGQSDLGFSLSQTVSAGMKILLETGLGQEKENAADEAGILTAAQFGYAVATFPGLVARLEKNSGQIKLHKTHPPTAQRMKNLETYLKAQGLSQLTQSDPPRLVARFQASIGKERQIP